MKKQGLVVPGKGQRAEMVAESARRNFEIRFHGRGGQGVVLAATVLATAFFKEGKLVQAFPSFGAERRGAPVKAFLRVSDQVITERSDIHKPDCLIILQKNMLLRSDVLLGLRSGGWIILNGSGTEMVQEVLKTYRVASVDAVSIAKKLGLGSESAPIINTTILGAFARATRRLGIGSLTEAIRESVPVKAEENAQAALAAYESTVVLNKMC